MVDITRAETRCPYCGKNHDSHSGPKKVHPKDGDVGICWGCRQAAIYVVGPFGIALRLPTDDERTEIERDPTFRRALAAAAESYTPVAATDLWRHVEGEPQ